MREIGKYRGKRKDNKEWAYGFYIETISPAGFHGVAIYDPEIGDIPVIPETIGESVGLKDCKRTREYPEGQEIYEGDLLLTPHEPCSMVAWCSCGWMPFLRDQQTEPRFYLGRDVEVIGNIHENESQGKSG